MDIQLFLCFCVGKFHNFGLKHDTFIMFQKSNFKPKQYLFPYSTPLSRFSICTFLQISEEEGYDRTLPSMNCPKVVLDMYATIPLLVF
jgi:hypothetical protein